MANAFLSKRTFKAYNQVTQTPISVTQAVINYDTPSTNFVVRPQSSTQSIAVVGIGYLGSADHLFKLLAGSELQEEMPFFAGQGYSYPLGSTYWVTPPGSDLIINISIAVKMKIWTALFIPGNGPPILG